RDPEDFFPAGTTGIHLIQANDAKAFCRGCPVALTCASWAIQHRVSDGIYGGLTESQRRRITRRGHLTDDEITDLVKAAWGRDIRNPLVEAYLNNSVQGSSGHVWWRRRATTISVAGRVFTPAQLAFGVGHGREPDGHVKATCGQPFCVAAEHLADSTLRRRAPARATA
ncbi:WhiB family transcriptional regulator, partial [Streptomyces purpureus]